MDRKQGIWLYCLVALISSCAAPLPPVADQAKPPQTMAPVILADEIKTGSMGVPCSPEKKKDEELFHQAMQQIADPSNQDASATAKRTLETLISSYPQSQWNAAARAILRLMGELETYRQRLTTEQGMAKKLAADKISTLQESEQLKKELRLLSEKYQTDLADLQLENEQLKKDLQLLKNLEIQLDRREKMLR